MKSFAFLFHSSIFILLFLKSRSSVVPLHEPSQTPPRSFRNNSSSARKKSSSMTHRVKISPRTNFTHDIGVRNKSTSSTFVRSRNRNMSSTRRSSRASSPRKQTVDKHSTDDSLGKQSTAGGPSSIHVTEENKLFKDSSVNVMPGNESVSDIQTPSLLSKTSDRVRQKATAFLNSLRRKTLDFLASQAARRIPEQTIESQYLQFVERAVDHSTWHVRLFRYITGSLDSAISKLAADVLDEAEEEFERDSPIAKHRIDSENQTVRAEITAGSGDESSDGESTFHSMPANAEDLIKGFKPEEGGDKFSIAPSFAESVQDEEEYSEEDQEEEETAVAEQINGVEKPMDSSDSGLDVHESLHGEGKRSDYDHSIAQGPLSGGILQNDMNAEGGGEGIQSRPYPREVVRDQDASSSHHYDENATGTAVGESHEESEADINNRSGNNAELKSGDDRQDRSKSTLGDERNNGTQEEATVAESVPSTENEVQKPSTKYTGSKKGIVNGHNTTQLSSMVYKIAKTEKVFSLAAAPCREVSSWMPEVVMRLEVELPGLQFYCVDMDEAGASNDDLKEAFGDISGGFIQCSPEDIESAIPNNLDLVVSWMGMQNWGIRKSWRFIKGLRRSGVRMALFSNNPMSGNGNPASKTINIRKSPLLFNEPQRVIGKVSSDDATQLLLYSMDGLREGF